MPVGDRVKVVRAADFVPRDAALQRGVDAAVGVADQGAAALQWCGEAAVKPFHRGHALCVLPGDAEPLVVVVLDGAAGIAAFPVGAVAVVVTVGDAVSVRPVWQVFYKKWRELTQAALRPAHTPQGEQQRMYHSSINRMDRKRGTVVAVIAHSKHAGQFAFVVQVLDAATGVPHIACLHADELVPCPADAAAIAERARVSSNGPAVPVAPTAVGTTPPSGLSVADVVSGPVTAKRPRVEAIQVAAATYACRGIGSAEVAALAAENPEWVRATLRAAPPLPLEGSLCGTHPIRAYVDPMPVMSFE
jgi:hypothetical protein